MAKTATAAAGPPSPAPVVQHQIVPLAQLRESPLNHRRTWGDMDELVASVQRQGVLQPVLARPVPPGSADEFELVFGHRRYRAAKKAGLAEIPAMVRVMTDAEVLEAQVVENVQRADVHPLEEAEGYEALLRSKERAYTVEDIAAKVGKSKGYIYGRMKLLALGPEARKAFYAGTLSASVALLVARMPVDLQVKAIQDLGRYGGKDEPVAFRTAVEVVHRSYMLDLAGAPFDPKDGQLVAGAGACADCPKRSGANPDLFGDVESGDVCSDPICFQAKTEAATAAKVAEAKAAGRTILDAKEAKKVLEPRYGRAGPASAKYGSDYVSLDATCHQDPKYRSFRKLLGKRAAEAVVLAPDEGGHLVELLPKGAVKKLLKAAGHDFKADRAGSATAAGREEQKKYREKAELDEAVERRAAALLGDALDQKEPTREVWDVALDALLDSMFGDADQVLERRFGTEDPEKALEKARPKMSGEQLRALFLELHLSSALGAFRGKQAARLFAWARIDVKKLEAEVKAERKDATRAKASPAAKGAQPAKGTCFICGCREHTPCAGGCAWTDRKELVCTAHTAKEIEAAWKQIHSTLNASKKKGKGA